MVVMANGLAPKDLIGVRGGIVGWIFTLFCWQVE
jgi:hypothetical protein